MKLLLLSLLCSMTAVAQDKYPMYDSAKGVVVYYDRNLIVKADSAILVRRADKTICEQYKIIDCGSCQGCDYYKPYWYEWRIIKTKDRYAIPVREKISFHPDPKR